MPVQRPSPVGPTPRILTLVGALTLAACSGGGGGGATAGAVAPGEASEAEWRTLATPRTTPADGAVRVSVGDFELVADTPWNMRSAVPLDLGISELVAAGLLRRGDVHFVERRRFAAAADAERRGQTRPDAAPAAGVSPGPEFVLSGAWSSVGLSDAYLDLRLTDPESGRTVTAWRTVTPADADPIALARSVVGSLLESLEEMDRLPPWSDPVPGVVGDGYQNSGISLGAMEAFLDGLAAEESWAWEAARRGYQTALDRGGDSFVEAAAALARTARLRNGGTLGAS